MLDRLVVVAQFAGDVAQCGERTRRRGAVRPGRGAPRVERLLPQVAPNWLSYGLLRFEINVRASAILGFVGEGGIGADLKIALGWGQGRYDEVVAIFLLLFVTIVAIDQFSSRYRNRLVKGHH